MSSLPIALPKGSRGLQGLNGIQGHTGPRGANGISSNLYNFVAKLQVLGTPPAGGIYWDNEDQLSATTITLSHLTQLGNSVSLFLSVLKLGDYIVIQSKENSTNVQKWKVT